MTRMILLTALIVLYGSMAEIQASRITIENNCWPMTIWPAILTSQGAQTSSSTGFSLGPNESRLVDVPRPWTGRIWARTHCATQDGQLRCKTGDCASGREACEGRGGIPPASLVEVHMEGGGKQDFYDISLVDGFNLPVSVSLSGGSGNCKSISCHKNINNVCPKELQISSDGQVHGCKSACLAFNKPQYCCTGAYNQPKTCPPTSYSMIFERECPEAYSYAYDDENSTFTCSNGPDYKIKFCP